MQPLYGNNHDVLGVTDKVSVPMPVRCSQSSKGWRAFPQREITFASYRNSNTGSWVMRDFKRVSNIPRDGTLGAWICPAQCQDRFITVTSANNNTLIVAKSEQLSNDIHLSMHEVYDLYDIFTHFIPYSHSTTVDYRSCWNSFCDKVSRQNKGVYCLQQRNGERYLLPGTYLRLTKLTIEWSIFSWCGTVWDTKIPFCILGHQEIRGEPREFKVRNTLLAFTNNTWSSLCRIQTIEKGEPRYLVSHRVDQVSL